jgi:nitroreductase
MTVSAKDFSAFAASRRSTRDFLPKPVETGLLQEILADAMTAPSWSNTRPFLVAVAVGPKRDRLSAEFLARWDALAAARAGGFWGFVKLILSGGRGRPTSNLFISKPYVGELKKRAQKVGAGLYDYLGVKRGDRAARDEQWAKNYRFFDAPVELFIFTHKSLGKYSAADAGLFVQNLMLSAHARGLGTCAQGAVAIWEDAVRAEFDVPSEYGLLYGVAVGYPSQHSVNRFGAERIPASEITLY